MMYGNVKVAKSGGSLYLHFVECYRAAVKVWVVD